MVSVACHTRSEVGCFQVGKQHTVPWRQGGAGVKEAQDTTSELWAPPDKQLWQSSHGLSQYAQRSVSVSVSVSGANATFVRDLILVIFIAGLLHGAMEL